MSVSDFVNQKYQKLLDSGLRPYILTPPMEFLGGRVHLLAEIRVPGSFFPASADNKLTEAHSSLFFSPSDPKLAEAHLICEELCIWGKADSRYRSSDGELEYYSYEFGTTRFSGKYAGNKTSWEQIQEKLKALLGEPKE